MSIPQMGCGVADLDAVLGGLLSGDNVVWALSEGATIEPFVLAFLNEGCRRHRRCIYVRTGTEQIPQLPPGLEVFDARPRNALGEPAALEEALVNAGREDRHAYVVVDALGTLVRRWGQERTVAFYRRCCPRLFDVGAIAYWGIARSTLSPTGLAQISKVAQCFLELRPRQLRVAKADGRPGSVHGRLFRLELQGGEVKLTSEKALGHLGRALEALREEHHLSQGDLARLAGVTPSAISQVESGRRGLSLDTLLALAKRLGMGLDDLLDANRPLGYTLARQDDPAEGPALLLSSAGTGFHAYNVRLPGGASGAPPFPAKGTELILVGQGLIQLTIGHDTPVMRAGEAAVATTARVTEWRNLLAKPALIYWITGMAV